MFCVSKKKSPSHSTPRSLTPDCPSTHFGDSRCWREKVEGEQKVIFFPPSPRGEWIQHRVRHEKWSSFSTDTTGLSHVSTQFVASLPQRPFSDTHPWQKYEVPLRRDDAELHFFWLRKVWSSDYPERILSLSLSVSACQRRPSASCGASNKQDCPKGVVPVINPDRINSSSLVR